MSNVPLADQIAEKGEALDYGIAFELLSKPTQELDDTQLLLIANDLRTKRIKFLNGVADRPGSTAKPKKAPITEEEKKLKTEHLKQQLKLGGLEI